MVSTVTKVVWSLSVTLELASHVKTPAAKVVIMKMGRQRFWM
jgi:hypothetical protein